MFDPRCVHCTAQKHACIYPTNGDDHLYPHHELIFQLLGAGWDEHREVLAETSAARTPATRAVRKRKAAAKPASSDEEMPEEEEGASEEIEMVEVETLFAGEDDAPEPPTSTAASLGGDEDGEGDSDAAPMDVDPASDPTPPRVKASASAASAAPTSPTPQPPTRITRAARSFQAPAVPARAPRLSRAPSRAASTAQSSRDPSAASHASSAASSTAPLSREDLDAFEKLVGYAARCDRVLDATTRVRESIEETQARNAQLEVEIEDADARKLALQMQLNAADQRAKDLRKELADRKAAMLPAATQLYEYQQHHDALMATFHDWLKDATANQDSSRTLAGRFARAWLKRGTDTAHGLLQGAAALLPSLDSAMSNGELGFHPDDPEGECPAWALSSYIDRPRAPPAAPRAPSPDFEVAEDSEEAEEDEPPVSGKGKERAV